MITHIELTDNMK